MNQWKSRPATVDRAAPPSSTPKPISNLEATRGVHDGALTVPDVDLDDTALAAAFAYAAAGWYVIPVVLGQKNPGGVVGAGWQRLSTRDSNQIGALWAATDHGVALHCGRSGAVVFDVDRPERTPPMLAEAIAVTCPPFQATRDDQPGRGHYIFAMPAGRQLGNSAGRLGGEWGQVRGTNGVIVAAPSHHPDPHGHYRWERTGTVPELPGAVAALLPAATDAEDTATDAEVRAFLAEHTSAERPTLLENVCGRFEQQVTAGQSRHESAVKAAVWALREAAAGMYPAQAAVEALGNRFIASLANEPERHPEAEWEGILAWAVAQAHTDDPAARRRSVNQRVPVASEHVVGGPQATTKEETTSDPAMGKSPVTTKEESSAVPVADPAVFHGVLGDIVRAAAPSTEADLVGILASLMAGVGVAIGCQPHILVGNSCHPLLVWPMLFGSTGAGRKGEATATARRVLAKAEPAITELTVGGLSSGEGLIERIRDIEDENDKGGTEDKRLLVIEPEFSGVMARPKRDGNTLAAVLRQAWDGDALNVLNRARIQASASHIAIIGHITPHEFRLRLAQTELAGGTYNRFLPLFVSRSRRLPIPPGLADETLTKCANDLKAAIASVPKGKIIFGQSARTMWCDQLYDELTEMDDEEDAAAEFTRRAAPYCLRIAGLHAVLAGRQEISESDLTAAAALVRYSIASAQYVLDRQHRDPHVDKIRQAIAEAGEKGLSRTQISALFSRNLPKATLDTALDELTRSGHYAPEQQATGGRAAVVYRRKQATT